MSDGRIGIEVTGITELRASFAKAGNKKELDRGLRAAHRTVAKDVETDTKAATASGTAQQRKAIRAILGQGTPTSAILRLRNSKAVPYGIGAFMGAIVHKQFPAWVGTSWDIESGVGPYVLAATISRDLEKIAGHYESAMHDTLAALGLPMAA